MYNEILTAGFKASLFRQSALIQSFVVDWAQSTSLLTFSTNVLMYGVPKRQVTGKAERAVDSKGSSSLGLAGRYCAARLPVVIDTSVKSQTIRQSLSREGNLKGISPNQINLV